MRELNVEEVQQVAGAGYLEDIVNYTQTGGTVGSVVGYVATQTVAGATRGGLVGAAFGLAWGLGTGIGSYAYNNYLRHYRIYGY